MNNASFKRTAKDWNCWSAQSVKFIEQYVKNRQSDTDQDEGFLRSCYILLSYSFELMIKSRLITACNVTEGELITNYKHNIEKILNKLSALNELKNIGIKSFKKDNTKQVYVIENTDDEKITINDFTDIRYEPKFGDYSEAHNIILHTTKVMLKISDKIHSLNKSI